MNITENSCVFRVRSSKSKDAKLYLIVLLEKIKRIEFYWATRGKKNKASYDFENVQVQRNLKNLKRLTISCIGETPWPKQQYFFDKEEYAQKLLSILAPSVELNKNNKISIGVAPDDYEHIEKTKDKGINRIARGLVSKKLRFQLDGFDLDLSYITPRILAMGFPSEGKNALYRNPLNEVRQFFKKYHQTNYRIYNLCSEKKYKSDKFENGQCAYYPFDDHNPPPFNIFIDFCKDVDDWLNLDDKNVAAIHCKAGKGRTGTVIAAYLVYAQALNTAKDALMYFAQKRTSNCQGVTIPSQRRYVAYFTQYIQQFNNLPPAYLSAKTLRLRKIIINTIPMIEDKGCTPYFILYNNLDKDRNMIYNYYDDQDGFLKRYTKYENRIVFDVNILLSGDIRVQFYDAGKAYVNKNSKPNKTKIFHTWFNSNFIHNNEYNLRKKYIDKARKDKKSKKFKYDFNISFQFEDICHYADDMKDNNVNNANSFMANIDYNP